MDGRDMNSEVFLNEKRGRYTYTKKIDQSFAAAWEGKIDPLSRPQGNCIF